MMDWATVGKLIGPLAPVLGGVIGGFIPVPGAAIAGQALGNVVARALGVAPTPEAVAGAIGTTPNDVLIAKLNAASEEARAAWPAYAQAEQAYFEAQAKLAESVNVTMRAELANQNLFFTGWRPAAGWVFDAYAVLFGAVLFVAALQAMFGNKVPLQVLTDAWPIFAAFFGILAAMVGVYVIGRSTEKVARTTDAPAPVVPPAIKLPVRK